MSPAAENVIERLDAARQKWWLVSLLTTVVLAFVTDFGDDEEPAGDATAEVMLGPAGVGIQGRF